MFVRFGCWTNTWGNRISDCGLERIDVDGREGE